MEAELKDRNQLGTDGIQGGIFLIHPVFDISMARRKLCGGPGKDMTAPTLTDVEQTKLFANALDRASTACFTVGIATPVAAMIYGIGNIGIKFGYAVLSYLMGWLLISVFLHLMARRVLRRLR